MSEYKLTVISGGEKTVLAAKPGDTVHAALNAAGVFVDAPCGGNEKCAKCLVRASGAVSEADARELALLAGREGRLACFAVIEGDCEVTLPSTDGMLVAVTGAGASFAHDPKVRSGLGAAVDVGTTTVACYLFDLATGEKLGASGEMNPQRSFGADVVSRIESCVQSRENETKQHKLITDQVKAMLSALAAESGRELNLSALVVAGNTTMEHLFAGLSPVGLAKLPFTCESLFGEDFCIGGKALDFSGNTEVFLCPAVSGFVGGDITAAALFAGLSEGAGCRLLMDIGTNGELALAANGGLYCCATAAGPAFEGADISCGMSAGVGAVRRVALQNGELMTETVGNVPARGVCGSGLIDALAAMLELGAVDETGRLLPEDESPPAARPYLSQTNGALSFRVADGVTITEADVRKLQLAKAAIAAGAETILEEAGVTAADVETLYLAGGFGAQIDPVSAARIGLFPEGAASKAVPLGNAAGMGACAVLCSQKARGDVTALRDRMKYVDLSSDVRFMMYYVDKMGF